MALEDDWQITAEEWQQMLANLEKFYGKYNQPGDDTDAEV